MADGMEHDPARALIDRIEADATAEAAAIAAAATDRAAGIVAAARAQARDRVRARLADLRRTGAQEMRRLEARFDTERRQMQQARHATARDAGLAGLPAALGALWAAPESRRAWADALIGEARARLLPGNWVLVHPPGWPDADRDALLAGLADHTGQGVTLRADPDLVAGLAIIAGAACLDATLPALLHDRDRLGARFLRLLESAERGAGA